LFLNEELPFIVNLADPDMSPIDWSPFEEIYIPPEEVNAEEHVNIIPLSNNKEDACILLPEPHFTNLFSILSSTNGIWDEDIPFMYCAFKLFTSVFEFTIKGAEPVIVETNWPLVVMFPEDVTLETVICSNHNYN